MKQEICRMRKLKSIYIGEKQNCGVSLTGEVYDIPCHDKPYFRGDKKWALNLDDIFEGADFIKKHHVCPPCYPGLKDESWSMW